MARRWNRYVPVSERRAKAAREVARRERSGREMHPVVGLGRNIARSHWGEAWCDHLATYARYENRLPRGRTYVRNGSVIDLQISEGLVSAEVMGSDLYAVEIAITKMKKNRWSALVGRCSGSIHSLIELLEGRISESVMGLLSNAEDGLFPKDGELQFSCSCPDWALMCKHVAASLYGVGVRLDENPELLFLLRGIDQSDLITQASVSGALSKGTDSGAPVLEEDEDLGALFGIELESVAQVEGSRPKSRESSLPRPEKRTRSSRRKRRRRTAIEVALEALPKESLRRLAGKYAIPAGRLSRAALIETLDGHEDVAIEDILLEGLLARDLSLICESLGLPTRGRKGALAESIWSVLGSY